MIVDIFIAGTQKSGTSSLFYYLSLHPNLTPPRIKETHHFDNELLDWSTVNQERFHTFFDPGPPGTRYFEATPIYCFWPPSLGRIHRYNPRAQIILVFRDPIARAYSHWRMERLRNTESLSFTEAIREGRARLPQANPNDVAWRDQSYVERGFYGRMLTHAQSIFPPKQILCLNSANLDSDHGTTLSAIARFLDIPDFAQTPPIREHQTVVTPHLAAVSREDYEYLRNLYAPDLEVFAALSGLDISTWWICRDFDGGIR